jgi:hypothetical protein
MREKPKVPTPEETASVYNERILSDAELIKGGGGYAAHNENERFDVTEDQQEKITREMIKEGGKFPKIELPIDVELVSKMKKKLEEYRERLDSEITRGENNNANSWRSRVVDSYYKFNILKELLDNQHVTIDPFLEKAKENNSDSKIIENAFMVIWDYCNSEGKGNFRGSLPESE